MAQSWHPSSGPSPRVRGAEHRAIRLPPQSREHPCEVGEQFRPTWVSRMMSGTSPQMRRATRRRRQGRQVPGNTPRAQEAVCLHPRRVGRIGNIPGRGEQTCAYQVVAELAGPSPRVREQSSLACSCTRMMRTSRRMQGAEAGNPVLGVWVGTIPARAGSSNLHSAKSLKAWGPSSRVQGAGLALEAGPSLPGPSRGRGEQSRRRRRRYASWKQPCGCGEHWPGTTGTRGSREHPHGCEEQLSCEPPLGPVW